MIKFQANGLDTINFTTSDNTQDWRQGRVFAYIVFWIDTDAGMQCGDWKRKAFSTKKEAKQFAKRKRKENKRFSSILKPYILQRIVGRGYFKKDAQVEATNKHSKYSWSEYYRKISY